MPGFSIRNPYFVMVICLALLLLGVLGIQSMPADLFPPINIPQLVLAVDDQNVLPPGPLPPVVLKFDASSLPVCLLTVKGEGLNETQLHDLAQFQIRNQIPGAVKGAGIPPPFGGKYRQVMVYVDPYKLIARQLSPMDVVNAVNQENLILPAGGVKMGPFGSYFFSH